MATVPGIGREGSEPLDEGGADQRGPNNGARKNRRRSWEGRPVKWGYLEPGGLSRDVRRPSLPNERPTHSPVCAGARGLGSRDPPCAKCRPWASQPRWKAEEEIQEQATQEASIIQFMNEDSEGIGWYGWSLLSRFCYWEENVFWSLAIGGGRVFLGAGIWRKKTWEAGGGYLQFINFSGAASRSQKKWNRTRGGRGLWGQEHSERGAGSMTTGPELSLIHI